MFSTKWTGELLKGFLYYDLDKDSKLHDSAVIYDGVQLRPKMTLIMGENTFIGTNAVILVPKLVMEKGSQINAGAILTGKQPIYLGRNVVVSYGVVMITASDTPAGKYMNDASPETERKIRQGPITVMKDSFIGANAVIMPATTIGERTVIGAGCYIDKPVASFRKIIPLRSRNLEREKWTDSTGQS